MGLRQSPPRQAIWQEFSTAIPFQSSFESYLTYLWLIMSNRSHHSRRTTNHLNTVGHAVVSAQQHTSERCIRGALNLTPLAEKAPSQRFFFFACLLKWKIVSFMLNEIHEGQRQRWQMQTHVLIRRQTGTVSLKELQDAFKKSIMILCVHLSKVAWQHNRGSAVHLCVR